MKEGDKKRILVLEDEKPLAHALELKLTKEGFDVVVANNGDRGIELLEKESFDIVLSDLIIPGTDGFGILEMVKNKKMKVPVIIMTNLNQEEDKKKTEDLGASGFFVKSNSTVSQIVEGVKEKIHSK
jgi:DNA-binding response OmpR family regulator